MKSLTQCLLAGMLMGAAHLHPAACPIAFAGLALLIGTIARCPQPRMAVVGWLLAAILAHAVALFWLVTAAELMLSISSPRAFSLVALGWIGGGVLTGAPGAIGLLVLGQRARPALSLLWIGGECLCEQITQFPGGHLVYGQWSNPVVLRSLSMVGWWPTTLGCVMVAEVLVILWGWRPLLATLTCALGCLGAIIPSEVPRDPVWLAKQLGAWPMTTFVASEATWPSGVDLIIWPEVTERDVIRGEEGLLSPPVGTSMGETGLVHLRGGLLQTQNGTMNAAFLVNELGEAYFAHGKHWLAPVGESPLLGWAPMNMSLIPGDTSPTIAVHGRVVLIVICFEAYVRDLFAIGLRSKPTLVAAMASDRPLGGSHVAVMQQIGVLALRAAEYRIPVVRASKGGQSAIIDDLGHVNLVKPYMEGSSQRR